MDGGNSSPAFTCVSSVQRIFLLDWWKLLLFIFFFKLLISVQFHRVSSTDQDYTFFSLPNPTGSWFSFGWFKIPLTEALNARKFKFPLSTESPKMQQPSIGGWSVALVALLFLLNAAFITANQGRIIFVYSRTGFLYLREFRETEKETGSLRYPQLCQLCVVFNRFNETVNIEIITTGKNKEKHRYSQLSKLYVARS